MILAAVFLMFLVSWLIHDVRDLHREVRGIRKALEREPGRDAQPVSKLSQEELEREGIEVLARLRTKS
jgi:hypothetical protein